MFELFRFQMPLLFVCSLTLFWQPVCSEFACQQLNSIENVNCTETKTYSTIVFKNEDHFKIHAGFQRFTFSCFGSNAEILEISKNLPNITLGRLNDIIIDGCIPFENIFEKLGIIIGTIVKVQRGVTDTPLVGSHLSSLSALSYFTLSGFEKLQEDVFANFVQLKELELTRVESPMPGGLFVPIGAYLERLEMRENRIATPPEGLFAPLQRLENLDLSFNELTTITSATFEKLYNLSELDLSNNQIAHLPADAFKSLSKLTILYLSNNNFKQLELGTFAMLHNLQHLEIENNALHFNSSEACSIFDGLRHLEYLELSSNKLSVFCLPHDMRSVRVKVANNEISELLVPTGYFEPRQLANLNVRYNRLESLSNVALQYLHDSLAELTLSYNPWKCDCESVLWLDFIKLNHERVVDLEELSCTGSNGVGHVEQLTSSDVCKQKPQIYYLAAIAALAILFVAALITALLYRRAAKKNCGGAAEREMGDLEKIVDR